MDPLASCSRCAACPLRGQARAPRRRAGQGGASGQHRGARESGARHQDAATPLPAGGAPDAQRRPQATVVDTGEVVAVKKVLQDKRFKNREFQVHLLRAARRLGCARRACASMPEAGRSCADHEAAAARQHRGAEKLLLHQRREARGGLPEPAPRVCS